jgi:ATPase family associated with various cellular activities (AAA)
VPGRGYGSTVTTPEPPADRLDADQAREFAAAFRSFLEWVHRGDPAGRHEVVALIRDFLGPEGGRQSVVSRDLSPFEHVNVQVALDSWSAQPGRTVAVHGFSVPPHYGAFSLQQLLSGEGLPPMSLSAPALVDLPDGPGSTRACLRLALLLIEDAAGRYVLMVRGPMDEPILQLAVAGLPVAAAQEVLADLDARRARLNVYRGHLLEVAPTDMGGVALHFLDLPPTARADVILPEAVLGRIERHALGVADNRAALLAAGQHLKRGLLIFGPPGTGKTHTTRYLVTHMTAYTRLMLSGRALHAIGAVADLARELEPAVVVLEDVDLVALDRSFGPGANPVLFELLDTMDGAAADADLLFLLTTNRADLLEPALAARPGRVDVAVEIERPGADAREQLLRLYARRAPFRLSDSDVAGVVERTDGVTASFLKELVRRAVLEAVHDDAALPAVTAVHLTRALDDLLDSAQAVTRTLLGVGGDADAAPDAAPAAGGLGAGAVPAPYFRRHPRAGMSRSYYD